MITIEQHTFNPFQENTYLVYDETKECIVIDPGMYTEEEKNYFSNLIDSKGLTLKRMLLTHSHLDHIFGCAYIAKTYNLELESHPEDEQTLNLFDRTVQLYQIPNTELPPKITHFFNEGDQITFGNSFLDILHVPGHAPGHTVFVDHNSKAVVNGDCLFYGSIGRTDLPGGNHEQLLNSIRKKLFTLGGDYKVYCGHGPATTIGFEKKNNPFF